MMLRRRVAHRALGLAVGAAAIGVSATNSSVASTTQRWVQHSGITRVESIWSVSLMGFQDCGGGRDASEFRNLPMDFPKIPTRAVLSFLCRPNSTLEILKDLSVGVPRFLRAMGTAGLIAADYKLLDRLAEWQGVEEGTQAYTDREHAVHTRTAERILHLALRHGGIWIKLCQYVSTLKPMIPDEYTSTLGRAQDSAQTTPYEDVAKVIERELGSRPEDLFLFFEKEPIAAASIAQVHRAITRDGERVAVKVQYPSLPREIGADIASLRVSRGDAPSRFQAERS